MVQFKLLPYQKHFDRELKFYKLFLQTNIQSTSLPGLKIKSLM